MARALLGNRPQIFWTSLVFTPSIDFFFLICPPTQKSLITHSTSRISVTVDFNESCVFQIVPNVSAPAFTFAGKLR